MKKILVFTGMMVLLISLINCTQSNKIIECNSSDSEVSDEINLVTYNIPDIQSIPKDYIIRFDSLFFAWKHNWTNNPITMVSSNTYDARKLSEYPQLLALGEKSIPLLISKLMDEDNFFALVLYEEIQKVDSLKPSTTYGAEQDRAKEVVEKYLESKKALTVPDECHH